MVDFKLIQMILHILARQMRLLEQKVVLEVGELPAPTVLKKKGDKKEGASSQSTSEESKRSTQGREHESEDRGEAREGRVRL